MRPLRTGIVAVALLLAFVPTKLAGQVAGRTEADNGRPLEGVAVELWAGSQRLVVRNTGSDGTFAFGTIADTARGPLILTARKIGFRPVSLAVDRNAPRLTIILAALPRMLDEVTVSTDSVAPRDPCSRTPSVQASTIFARAAAYYRDDTRWLDRVARYAHAIRSTTRAERETLVGVPLRGSWTRNAGLYDGAAAENSTAVPRRLTQEERAALPFPVPERKTDAHRQIVGWLYPRFHEWGSPSFVSRAFVDSMPKAVVSRSRTGIVLAFCPRARRIPYTSGEIELGADSTIIAIRWRFVIAKPGEETGGTAIFAPPESKTVRAHLLPANAIVWTKLPNSDRYESTEYSYGRWFVAELGESVRVIPP